MKAKLTMICGLILTATCLYAKGQSGVYKNVTDYSNNTLTYASDCKEKFKVHLHDFWGNTPSFTIIGDGEKHKIKKAEVYGYRDCNNNSYRFYANAVYKIVEAGNIYIYTQQRNITRSKGFIVVNEYFFSTSPGGDIFHLTLTNLASAYNGNEKFISQLESYNGDATAYDARHKMFRVNYLYTISKQ